MAELTTATRFPAGLTPWELARAAGRLSEPLSRDYFRKLHNTYLTNYINLSLVFRGKHTDRQIRRMARGALWTFAKNELYYLFPRAWRGIRIYNSKILDEALSEKGGALVACQHLGPQRYALPYVAERTTRLHTAITESFVDRLHAWIERVIGDTTDEREKEIFRRISPLEVEKPTCALTMVRALKRGETVFFDVDGNIGVGGEEKTEKEMMEIGFLDRRVHVRTGIAYLSYRTGAPIVPIIPLWDARGFAEISVYPRIVARAAETLEEFEARALTEIYGRLEATLRERPDQWEMWPQLARWITSPPKLDSLSEEHLATLEERLRTTLREAPDTRLEVCAHEAFVLRIRKRYLLVDRRNFRFFLVPKGAEQLLRALHRGTPIERVLRAVERLLPREETIAQLAKLDALDLLQRTRAA